MHLRDMDISATVVNGNIESLYIVFRGGVTAKHTIAFSRADGAELYVDVDDRNQPVAMQLVDSFVPQTQPEISQEEANSVALDLFSFASKMVAFHEANAQALGNDLIVEAIQSAYRLTPVAA